MRIVAPILFLFFVLYRPALYETCTVRFLNCTVIVLHCTALQCGFFFCMALDLITLHCSLLHLTALYCTVLHCTPSTAMSASALHWNSPHIRCREEYRVKAIKEKFNKESYFMYIHHKNANLKISPDFPVHQKKSEWLYIWVVVVVVCCGTQRLGTRTNMSATEVE